MPKGLQGFQKGHPQFNTGRTHLKKGHTPWNKGMSEPWLDTYGYYRKGDGKKKILHRMIMEEYLGRKLKQTEIVHHINEDRTDNCLENLEIMTRGQHCSLHQPYNRKENYEY